MICAGKQVQVINLYNIKALFIVQYLMINTANRTSTSFNPYITLIFVQNYPYSLDNRLV